MEELVDHAEEQGGFDQENSAGFIRDELADLLNGEGADG